MELQIDFLMDELHEMLNNDHTQELIIRVFKILVKVFCQLKTASGSRVKFCLNQLTRLAHEHPSIYEKYFSILFSSEVLQCKDHDMAVNKTLENIGKFLSKYGDLESCLSVLYCSNGSINKELVSSSGESLCTGIIDVACRSYHMKAIAELRSTISRICDILELLFHENALLEKMCINNILNHLFTNAHLKCEKKKSEPILPLLVGGILQNLDLRLVEDVVLSTVSEFHQASSNVDHKGWQNDVLITVGSSLFQWLSLPYSSNASWIVLIYCRTLVSCKCFVPLMNILNKEMDRLPMLIKLPIMRSSTLHVYINLQLSFRSNPIFFKKHCKELTSLIIHLKQVKGHDASLSVAAAQKLVLMVQCLFYIHPQIAGVCPELLKAIKLFSDPSDEEIIKVLSENASIFSKGFFSIPSTRNVRGLSNLGNTCYINCIVQCLFACTGFSREVLQSPLYSGQFSKSLQVTFANLLMSKSMTHTPKEVVDCISKFFPMGLQHDCSEFLTHYLDAMSEELSQAEESIVSKYFRGHMKNTVRCLECSAHSEKIEQFIDLPITIPAEILEAANTSHDLCTLIKNHFKEETLQGENMYLCNRCKKMVSATKSHFITKAPEYLVVTLLRFYFDGQSRSRRKVTPMINCSRFIELPLKEECETTSTSLNSEQDQGIVRSISYELRAMTIHAGTSLESGHYYSLVLLPNSLPDPNSSNIWHLIDDNEVRQISSQEFSNITCGTPIQTPYVLFFAKHNAASSLPLSEGDVAPGLKKMVEEQNEIFGNQKKQQGSSSNHPISNRRYPDQSDDDDDEDKGTTSKGFQDGPRLIF